MARKNLPEIEVVLEKIVGGGQALGTLSDGKKVFVWGGLPGERVRAQVTKKKSSYLEATVTEVITPSRERTAPQDPDSYLSTSPWQIMTAPAEQHYKAALIEEAFELHDIVLPQPIDIYTDGTLYKYRNKIEYSFWYDTEREILQLAFFRRGTHGKISIDATSLASPAITTASQTILAVLNRHNIGGRSLKTLLIRSNAQGEVAWQLYVKDEYFETGFISELQNVGVSGEIIYSDPRSPASAITKRLTAIGQRMLHDIILGTPFSYAVDGFFQINLPVYETALNDMRQWVPTNTPTVDMYSGVGTIGLTIGGNSTTMIEVNERAVNEMKRNITALHRSDTTRAILAPSETALEYITQNATIIVDPPRAGLHTDVIRRLLEVAPPRIIYLSCNPVTQARDVALLAERYGVRYHRGYNFFPRTPHIEHLIVLDKKT